jgi:hypothetical protein
VTITANDTSTTTDLSTIITVEDAAGLEALPEGTVIQCFTGSGHKIRKQGDGFVWQQPASIEGRKVYSNIEDMEQGTGWLPATVVNPESLGDFRPSQVGSVVRLLEDVSCYDLKAGQLAIVREDAGDIVSVDDPSEDRELAHLYPGEWETATIQVGDRVRVIDADYNSELGDTGVVRQVAPFSLLGDLLTVATDRGVTIQMFDYRFELVVEPVEIAETVEEPVEDEVPAYPVILDSEALHSLPVGSVVTLKSPNAEAAAIQTSQGYMRINQLNPDDVYAYNGYLEGSIKRGTPVFAVHIAG